MPGLMSTTCLIMNLFLKGFELVNIRDIDHLTLTVTDIARSLRFYHEVFDLPIVTFDGDRQAVLVGKQKLTFRPLTSHTNPLRLSRHPVVQIFA